MGQLIEDIFHVAFDNDWLRAANDQSAFDVHRRRQPLARAEAFLTADKDRQFGFQLALVLIEKADKPAEMVVMAMREDERVDFAGIEGKQGNVVIESLWRVTKINENVARLRSCLRRCMQG